MRWLAWDLLFGPNILGALRVSFSGDLVRLHTILAAVALQCLGWFAIAVKCNLQRQPPFSHKKR